MQPAPGPAGERNSRAGRADGPPLAPSDRAGGPEWHSAWVDRDLGYAPSGISRTAAAPTLQARVEWTIIARDDGRGAALNQPPPSHFAARLVGRAMQAPAGHNARGKLSLPRAGKETPNRRSRSELTPSPAQLT